MTTTAASFILTDIDALPEVLSADQAADVLPIGARALINHAHAGHLKAFRVGRKIFFHKDDLIDFIQPLVPEPDTETVSS